MTSSFLGGLVSYFDFLWYSFFLLLAPMLLLGLFLCGLIHVFIPRQTVLQWLQKDDLRSVSTSAAIGVPIPLCSCSVVPVVAEMRRKGASRSSCMSFLITAPETGADSILVTNAFFGWAAALTRPLVSFITAVIAGLSCIGLVRDDQDEGTVSKPVDPCCEHDHGHRALITGGEDCYVSPRRFTGMTIEWLKGRVSGSERRSERIETNPAQEAQQEPSLREVIAHMLKYGFVEIADDIMLALLLGMALGGLLFLAIPGDLMTHEYARWLAYPAMVLFGVPLYICASASTPIAAALVAKGLSPGAALVFLMTGPATNTGTIAIIMSQFGARFSSIYVGVVIGVTLVLGIAIDLLLLATGFGITVNLAPSEAPALQWLQWTCAAALLVLIVWRSREGALKSGFADLMSGLRPLARPFGLLWTRLAGR